jgi:hypothetical protein
MTMAEMDVDQVRALLAPLWAKNRGHVLERLAHVRAALVCTDDPPSEAVRSDLHALVGTLGTYGFPDGSELATEILRSLSDHETVDRSQLVHQLDLLTARLSEA